jgi:pimeloyl-ACP methyl ester carboxylesterase
VWLHEGRLNRFAQFTTEIDGLDIHFLHVRSPHLDAMPLIITHGWPGSVVEFHKVIEPLTDPTAHGGNATDAFDVICPSLPGFGFSATPATDAREILGLDRLRWPPREHPRPRRVTRQCHALLGDGDCRLVSASILGNFWTEAPHGPQGDHTDRRRVFPKEIVTPVRKWMETSYTNIRRWSEMPKGGYFAAFEQPGLFVPEVRDFFRTLR